MSNSAKWVKRIERALLWRSVFYVASATIALVLSVSYGVPKDRALMVVIAGWLLSIWSVWYRSRRALGSATKTSASVK